MEAFEVSKAKDFKATIIKYLEDQMAHQQQVSIFFKHNNFNSSINKMMSFKLAKYWEAFIPTAKEIPTS